MNKISLSNFRVFDKETNFDLAPVTILTGKNNSGKSSLIKSFILLDEFLSSKDHTFLDLNGPRLNKHKVNNFGNLKNWQNTANEFQVSYSKDGFDIKLAFEGDKEDNYAFLKQFIVRASEINEELVFEKLSTVRYDLQVSQRFIDYLTKGEEFKKVLENEGKFTEDLRKTQLKLNRISELIEKNGYYKHGYDLGDISNDNAIRFNYSESGRSILGSEVGAYDDYLVLIEEKQKLESRIDQLTSIIKATTSKKAGAKYKMEFVTINASNDKTLAGIVQNALTRYFDQSNKSLFVDSSDERRTLIKFAEKLRELTTVEFYHLGPNRTYQSRLYLKGIGNSEINSVIDEYVKQAVEFDETTKELLEFWLKKFELGDSVRVESVEGFASKIIVSKNGQDINLTDLGFGAGQLLTILLLLASVISKHGSDSNNKSVILIEEPEANLHPKLQSYLAMLFMYAAKDDSVQFIIESHSEYLIRKLQLLIAQDDASLKEDPFKASDALIYYLENSEITPSIEYPESLNLLPDTLKDDVDGEFYTMDEAIKAFMHRPEYEGYNKFYHINSVRKIEILPDGKLSDSFGSGFFDEADEQALQLHRVQRKKQLEK